MRRRPASDQARARFGIAQSRSLAVAAQRLVAVAGDAVAGFVARAQVRHSAGVADDNDGVKIFRRRRRRRREISTTYCGQGNLDLVLAAARAEMGGGGQLREIVIAAGASQFCLINQRDVR